jgi:PAS domain S-box-containing protein
VQALRERVAALENDQRLHLVAMATHELIWDWDVRSDTVVYSGAPLPFELKTDTTTSVLDFWRARVHPDDRERAVAGLRAALAGSDPTWSDEYRYRRRDGTYAFVLDRGSILRDDGGAPMRVVGCLCDITERRRAEQLQQAVYRIARAADGTADLGSLYKEIHRIIAGVMPARCFFIALYDPDADLIQFPYYADCDVADDAYEPRRPRQGLTEYVLRTGKPLFFDRDKASGSLGEIQEVGRPSRVWLGVPLGTEGRVFGVMAVQDYDDPAAYGGPELCILEYVSSQVSRAIEKSWGELALSDSQSRLQTLLDAIPDHVFRHSRDGTYLDVKATDERDLVLPAAQLVGKNVADVFPPDLTATSLRLFAAALDSGAMQTHHFQLELAHGRQDFETRIVPSGPDEVVSIVRNVTDQRRALENLRLSEERFRRLFDEGPLGMALTDMNHRWVRVNNTLCAMLGYSREELTQLRFPDITHPEDRERDLRLAEQTIASELPSCQIEKRFFAKGGGIVWVRVFAAVVRDPSGAPLYGIAMIEDITERRREQAQLQSLETARRDLEQCLRLRVVQAQDDERAMLSRELHDGIGQLLTGLQLSLAAKNRNRDDLTKEIAYARQAAIAVGELSRLLHPPELEVARIGQVVAEYLCTPAGSRPRVAVQVEGEEPVLERESKGHIFRIVQEAVANALRHGEAEQVRIHFDWRPDRLLLAVTDDGKGMPAGARSGVGLRSIRDRAAILGGTVRWIAPAAGGTTVELEVPLLC